MRKILLGLMFSLVTSVGCAQGDYPARSVRIIVPFPVGQTADLIARMLAQKLTDSLGQSFWVEDKPGAGGIIGMEAAKNQAPDGYTLLFASSGPLAINEALYPNIPYKTLRDFTPIAMAVEAPQFIAVRSDFPVTNLQDLIEFVKSKSGKVNYGSGGTGLTNHLTMELLKVETGMQMTHIPYKGATPAMTALMAGDIDLMFESGPAVMPHVVNGKLKLIAVGSGHRSLALPQIPTVAESGVSGFHATTWAGLLAPQGLPSAIVDKVNGEVRKALADPALRERLIKLGAEPMDMSARESYDYIAKGITLWAGAVKASGATVD
jgi:tripartite-type tricarboxylate transporter receptor subunit TctC